MALSALNTSQLAEKLHIVVYTGDDVDGSAMLKRAKVKKPELEARSKLCHLASSRLQERFDVDLLSHCEIEISFVRLSLRWLVGMFGVICRQAWL
jgi:hypothetical protein